MSTTEGFICCVVTIFCFGTSFVPVKKFEAGDGIFFQWVMCVSIWMCGLVVQLIRDSPQFEPLAMVGGVLWATGNSLCVPVMRFLGIGLGMLVWATANLVVGWASGHFGFFGITPQTDINIPALNYAGVVVCLTSLGIFFFVKPTLSSSEDVSDTHIATTNNTNNNGSSHFVAVHPRTPLLLDHSNGSVYGEQHQELHAAVDPPVVDMSSSNAVSSAHYAVTTPDDFGGLDRMKPLYKRLAGLIMGCVAGCFFGLNFVPPQYLIDHPTAFGKTHSTNDLDYVFSHFTGILLASSLIVAIYSAVKRNRPSVYPQTILPGFACGVLWALAQISFFYR